MSDTETNLQAESEDQGDVNKPQNKIDAEVLQNIPVTISVTGCST